jgi:hypothetical protein
MSRRQRSVYARLVHESEHAYQVMTDAEWTRAVQLADRNRMTPDHPNYDRRRQVVARRLKRTYRDLQADLVAASNGNGTP